ncbi:MAG: efflux RND transporter periplasmic adaptor subunit [Gammaproteobacteria bacterium]
MKRVLVPIGILLASILLAGVLLRTPTQVEEIAPEIVPVAVRVTQVELDAVQLVVESQGKVQAAQTVNLSAPLAGQVSWISPALEAGGYVEQDQVLLRIEDSDFNTALQRARAALQQVEAEASHAARELERIQELATRRLASDSQLQDIQRQARVTAARVVDAQASYNQAQLDLDRTELKAPFNAVIQAREVELGQYLNRAQNVAVLFGADEVEVRVPLAIKQLAYLDFPLGTRGELPEDLAPEVILTGVYGGEQLHWRGRLVRMEASIDPNSNTVQSIIRVNQSGQQPAGWSHHEFTTIPLPIGLFVQAEISGRFVEDIISLPRSVIRNNNQVLVVDAENKMHFRDVEIFRLEEERVLISGGLLPGEAICISPIQAVIDGMSVQPLREVI